MLRDPTTFVLVRHGHTAANGGPAGMRMSGWTDTPLSEEGIEEAQRVAEALGGEERSSALYASPLRRAVHTSQPIGRALRLSLSVDSGLREIFCGDVDGRSVDAVRAEYPEAWIQNAEERWESFRWPAGESYREFRARCLWTLRRLAMRHPGERIVLVTHAGFISQVFGWVMGTSCARWSAYRPANASISRLEWDRGLCRVLGFDERGHLAPGLAAARRPLHGA